MEALMSISKHNRPYDMGGREIVPQQTRVFKGGRWAGEAARMQRRRTMAAEMREYSTYKPWLREPSVEV